MDRQTTQLVAATAAATALASLASVYCFHRLSLSSPTSDARTPSSSSSTPDAPGDAADDKDGQSKEDNDKTNEEDKKRYDTARQFYSASTGRWEEQTEDDDDKDAQKRKRGILFTATQKCWPKGPEFAAYEDFVTLTLHSPHLTRILRDVPGLKECEDVFEDKPSVELKELFLVRDELRAVGEKKRAEVAKREAAETKEGEGKQGEEKKVEEKKVEEKKDVEAEKPTVDASSLPSSSKPTSSPSPEPAADAEAETETDDLPAPLVPASSLAAPPTLASLKEEVDHLDVLVAYVEEVFAPIQAKLQRLLHPPSPPSSAASAADAPTADETDKPTSEPFHPQISFPLLWAVFRPRSLAVAEHDVSGEKCALRVHGGAYNMTRDGPVFSITGTAIVWNGEKYARVWVEERIPKFKSLRRLSALPITPLVPSSKLHNELTARGKLYCGLTGDCADKGGMRFLGYEGVLMQVVGSGLERKVIKLRAEGRAVVDVKSYRRMNPSRAQSPFWDDDDSDPFLFSDPPPSYHPSSTPSTTVAPSDLCLLPPTVLGFSLAQREWGELLVTGFSEIRFRDDAWERLVLDGETKSLVRGLVECNEAVRRARRRAGHTGPTEGLEGKEGEGESKEKEEKEEKEVVTDIIEGKGGGLVIALHGTPGTGKTLTAEAVAESLRVPLYTVGAGSLGVHADVLETRLRDVLDIAQTWGATLLIDEADVFLEARSLHDVQRNAMVSVFLRMLEHHSGVLFLTTNRIRSIDEAFLSRFSLAITYPNLDRPKRKVVWRLMLELAHVGIESGGKEKGMVNGTTAPEKEQEQEKPEVESFVTPKYLDKLAAHSEFNGRQIKNIVRTAQSLAISQSTPLGPAQLDVVIKASLAFAKDFKDADEHGVYEAAGEGWKDRTNLFN
ncbi:hypothetical protein JCM10207_006222 [Rhodosporidiobolus poonsookiae]